MTQTELKTLLFMIHGSSIRNEQQIMSSNECGCFHCCKQFKPEDVRSWCDNDDRGNRTALCPYCGMDAVIGDACGLEISPDFLWLMQLQFFGEGVDNIRI